MTARNGHLADDWFERDPAHSWEAAPVFGVNTQTCHGAATCNPRLSPCERVG